MKRLSLGLAAAAASIFLSGPMAERPALRPAAPAISNEQRRKRSKRKRGPGPNGQTGQVFDRSRLICDRSSSVKKMQRWARRYPEYFA